jgi:hypothetical protein
LLQAYWPFHRIQCKRNEFADAIEEHEPRFARWMRKHGKQAVLKDDEVDRIERAGQAACGPGREVTDMGVANKGELRYQCDASSSQSCCHMPWTDACGQAVAGGD